MQAEQYALAPGHPLRPFIYGMWQLHVDSTHWRQRVLPRGVVNLMFPLDGVLTVTQPCVRDVLRLQGASFLSGLQRRSVCSEARGSLLMFGVSLRAHASRALLSVPAHEVAGLTIASADVLRTTDDLFGRLHDAATFRDRCAIALAWLAPRMRPPQGMARVEQARTLIDRSPDIAAIDRAAGAAGCSGRHLRRMFLDHVGTTPAEYLRLSRFNRALMLMPSSRSLTAIAYLAGYFDQAHFCRDFRELSGLTPGAYRAQAGPVPGILFSSDVRLIQAPADAVV